jgi:hypothetical protein
MVPKIERSLGPGVFADRTDDRARPIPWIRARRAWRAAGRSSVLDAERPVVVAGDVRDCYGSMGQRAQAALGVGTELRAFLGALIDAGVRGLPVGPDPSAILANAMIAIADREAAAAGCRPIRWVDDVLFVAAGRRSAQRAFDAWRRGLDRLGLEAHEGKTRWAVGRVPALALIPGRWMSAPEGARRGIIAAP